MLAKREVIELAKFLGYYLDDKAKREVDRAEIGFFNGIGDGIKERPICSICGKEILKGENFQIYYEKEIKKIKHKKC